MPMPETPEDLVPEFVTLTTPSGAEVHIYDDPENPDAYVKTINFINDIMKGNYNISVDSWHSLAQHSQE